jgi:hypothetical protein
MALTFETGQNRLLAAFLLLAFSDFAFLSLSRYLFNIWVFFYSSSVSWSLVVEGHSMENDKVGGEVGVEHISSNQLFDAED